MSPASPRLLAGLNNAQREAITAPDGPVLVLAGPGSGKTRVLTHRIAYLLEERGVDPRALVAVTFTNKAAAEMKSRVEALLSDRLRGLTIGTFHAICARLLRRESENTPLRNDFLIYDTDDQMAVITQAMTELNLDQKKFRPRAMLSLISSAKNELIEPGHAFGSDYPSEVAMRIYPRYQEILVANNARDFDDLLMDVAILFRNHPEALARYQRFYEVLLVDEFQDTNAAQYILVRQLAAPQNNVFVVGDEDQAIYAFRGADYRNVHQFRKDYPDARVILLEQNYRSTQIVLDAARAIIDQNTNRTKKALFTDRSGGVPIILFEAYSDQEEAEYVVSSISQARKERGLEWRDFAVMYRTNAQSRALEDAFIKEGLPYKLVGGVGFYKRREVRDLLAYLRLVNNADDSVSFARIVNVPRRGIGKKSVDDFLAWAAAARLTVGQAMQALADGEATPLPAAAVRKLVDFQRLLANWRLLAQNNDLGALLDEIIARIGYTLHLHETSDTPEEALEREENVRELRGLLAAKVGIPLAEFLEEIALVADVDTLTEEANSVTLLTLHAAKGLEFRVVFLTGLEEGLMPHLRAFDEPDGMSEERRLLYVGVTRAMDQLVLSYAFRRMMYGDSTPGRPSRFLSDIPAGLLYGAPASLAQSRAQRAIDVQTRWEAPSDAPKRSGAALGPALRFRSGQKVQHPRFGVGIVLASRRMGEDEEVTVQFQDSQVGMKRLAAGFANLQVVGETK